MVYITYKNKTVTRQDARKLFAAFRNGQDLSGMLEELAVRVAKAREMPTTHCRELAYNLNKEADFSWKFDEFRKFQKNFSNLFRHANEPDFGSEFSELYTHEKLYFPLKEAPHGKSKVVLIGLACTGIFTYPAIRSWKARRDEQMNHLAFDIETAISDRLEFPDGLN